MQLQPHVLGVAARGRGARELHVAPGLEVLDHPGLEGLDAAAVGFGARLAEGLLVLHAGDEGGEAGLDLLPHQLGLVVGVEVAELQHHRGEPRHAAHLPGPQPLEEVQHAIRRHPMRDQRPAAVAGMGRVEPVGAPPAERVELDALQDEAAVARAPRSSQLSRWSASSTCSCSGTGRPSSTRRSRSRTSTSPLSTRLRTISACRPAKSVSPSASAAAAKSEPEPIGLRWPAPASLPAPAAQPGADHVADQRLHRLAGVGVVAHEIARAVAEPGDRRGDLGVGAGAGGDPALGAAAQLRALVGAGEHRDHLPLAGTPQPRARRHRADRTDRASSWRHPLLKAAKLRRGFGRPAALAISASMVRMRARRSAAEPYSTLLPS